MEGRELREAVLRETSSGGPPYELEVFTMAMAMLSLEVSGTILLKITIFIKDGS
jgi:hypothetical protein